MLENGLGRLISREVRTARRFVDLFAGSAAVSRYVACRFDVPVHAYDLQEYSVVLADAVIRRESKFEAAEEWGRWSRRARRFQASIRPPNAGKITKSSVSNVREWCASRDDLIVTRAYGGHYFAPIQAVWIDAFRATLPKKEPVRTVGLAALIEVASQCAASPGHTAQPFQPTRTAKQFLYEAWSKEIYPRLRDTFCAYAGLFAMRRGKATVSDANLAARRLKEGDLVFIDPPYSGVHYSRFYHVLETIASGECGEVFGVGRYPSSQRRPRSRYSILTESEDALDELLDLVASSGAAAILTFPDHACSNGLSGETVMDIASEHFRISQRTVTTKFSTLGGAGTDGEVGRIARHHAMELMLHLKPR